MDNLLINTRRLHRSQLHHRHRIWLQLPYLLAGAPTTVSEVAQGRAVQDILILAALQNLSHSLMSMQCAFANLYLLWVPFQRWGSGWK